MLGNGRIVLYEKFQVLDRFELVVFEKRRLCCRISKQVLRRC